VKTTTSKNKGSRQPSSGDTTLESDGSARGGEMLESIATAAYYKAEARGFAPGREAEDWLEAEAEWSTGETT
jgi:hypothetical protein